MKKLLVLITISAALLVAFGNNEDEKDNKNKEEKKVETTQNKKENKKTEKENDPEKYQKKKNVENNVNKVSNQTKLALAFFAKNDSKYILDKDEVLQGVYEQEVKGSKEQKRLYKLLFIDDKKVENGPPDMKFYTVYPAKGSLATFVGLSKDKLFVGDTQGEMTYKDLLKTGKEYDLQYLYSENKEYKSLEELAKKIEFKKNRHS
ncbi:hypothetical protein RSA37_11595 [Mammaliicoccus sciuri]|uniref:hypothetical protein n=1 Tax=Mammaliicoccus sciuri TaxID=1296 RepID=UPI000734AD53|nr:hypothetical protein [Mammaliicoccus sciuri]KTT86808.1 hypothetical protein NS1R_01905 [Mammaliicoccus sciuri]KTT87646.1 hypothetical protein NS36R_12640 [Mammaliicoccus sciuri]KTT89734.1 hypothetical protein NS112_04865 [Mammaliicoccus sciuri]KTT92703.1 hypothetical protein NS44R_13445 [Mammaliicoccus sciuri]KTW10812.1 hypothetical protein RSA37_11595 [Mammaliicoccus sciuri]